MTLSVERVDHIVMNTRDVELTASWYERVLGFKRRSFGSPERVAIHFGIHKFNLRPLGQEDWMTCPVEAAGALDLCFIAQEGIADIIAHLTRCEVEIVLGPIQQPGALGVMTSVYFYDPDRNLIELASYG